MDKAFMNTCLRKGHNDALPDFGVLEKAIENLGCKIIGLKDDKLKLLVTPGTEFANNQETRTVIKELLLENWQFRLLWKLDK